MVLNPTRDRARPYRSLLGRHTLNPIASPPPTRRNRLLWLRQSLILVHAVPDAHAPNAAALLAFPILEPTGFGAGVTEKMGVGGGGPFLLLPPPLDELVQLCRWMPSLAAPASTSGQAHTAPPLDVIPCCSSLHLWMRMSVTTPWRNNGINQDHVEAFSMKREFASTCIQTIIIVF
jgi:hypothetical protein